MNSRCVRLHMYRTAIPMRKFEHAAASRELAESVVVRLEFSDGRAGWGQTLPRSYVTGETIDTVVRDLAEDIWPAFAGKDWKAEGKGPPEIPLSKGGQRCINAAACAFDIAWIGRLFEYVEDISAEVLTDLTGRARPRREIDAAVSGVLGSADPAKTAWRLRLMRLIGLTDFKLKLGLGDEIDSKNLLAVHRQIGRAVRRGKCTFRVDVNGAWDIDETSQRVSDLKSYGICVVEQPVFCSAGELVDLAQRCKLPLMADESLLTNDDAAALLEEPKKVWWNIRLCKNGGLVPSLRLARLAAEKGVSFVAGCMVGESSILSAAQRRFLQMAPAPRFVEGNYGRLLLSADLTTRPLQFGYAGKLKALRRPALGVVVDPVKVFRYSSLVKVLEA
ncbi:MAG: hypothetical protein ISS78_03085 [Phycisphaerae bacterium]|nr:hypothetical protein [Phycisphaerae bacterium]